MSNKNTRNAEILVDSEWIKVNPIDIKINDIFRMFEADGTPVIGYNNLTSWTAISDAYYNNGGIITIEI